MRPNSNIKHKETQPWYDVECKRSQTIFYQQLNKFRKDDSCKNRENMIRARSNYKNIVRIKNIYNEQKQTKKLESLRYQNANEYWKLFKSVEDTKGDISTD